MVGGNDKEVDLGGDNFWNGFPERDGPGPKSEVGFLSLTGGLFVSISGMGGELIVLKSTTSSLLFNGGLIKLLNIPPIIGFNVLWFAEEAVGIVITASLGLLLAC
jgi:hypothetical protein